MSAVKSFLGLCLRTVLNQSSKSCLHHTAKHTVKLVCIFLPLKILEYVMKILSLPLTKTKLTSMTEKMSQKTFRICRKGESQS